MDLESLLRAYDRAIKEEVEAASYLAYAKDTVATLRAKILTYNKSKPHASSASGEVAHVAAAVRPQSFRRNKQQKPSKVVAATIEAVRALGGGATTATFAKHLSITTSAARVRLIRATDKGFLIREGPGDYRLAVTSEHAVSG